MKRGVDYIGVGTGAMIVNESGELFLAKRGEKASSERGLWEFPGGGADYGETLSQALIREIYEEYGITIETGELLGVIDDIRPDENQHWISIAYLCRMVSGEPAICEPEKCTEIGWFKPDSLPENLTFSSRICLEAYLKHRS